MSQPKVFASQADLEEKTVSFTRLSTTMTAVSPMKTPVFGSPSAV